MLAVKETKSRVYQVYDTKSGDVVHYAVSYEQAISFIKKAQKYVRQTITA